MRILEAFETVGRDARGARLVTPPQLERIAVARVIASTRGVSRVQAIRMVVQLNQALDALHWLNLHRDALGIATLEARVTALEQRMGER